MQLKLGNAAILAYRRLPYKLWYAIAELVDNSTDAYFRGSNRQILDEHYRNIGEVLSVDVSYQREGKGTLTISDNSIGMSLEELEDALIIGEKPIVTSGRSEFGMGMKTAAIWFADFIEIRTKKLGEDQEHRAKIDIQKYVAGDSEIDLRSTPKQRDICYTIITLSGLQRVIRDKSLQRTRDFLGSIYREDIRKKNMKLTIIGSEVSAPSSQEDDAFLTRNDGSKVLVDVDLEVNGKRVKGWIGVLKPGFTGRSYAGLSLLRHGRAVQGWLDSWRPEQIFGDARNDLINQRVTGELIMDAFSASHTKDAIDWEMDEEDTLGEKLLKLCKDYGVLVYAKKQTRDSGNVDTEREKIEAQQMLQAQLTNKKVGDTIKLLDVPSPELAKFTTEVLIEAADQSSPIGTWPMDAQGRVAKLYEIEMSQNDPYYEYEVLANTDLRVVLNSAHPANVIHDTSTEARLTHYQHVVLDAIAEWKCAQMNSPLEPHTIRVMKDRLFRVIGEVSPEID
jgi:hypothetical protein